MLERLGESSEYKQLDGEHRQCLHEKAEALKGIAFAN